MIAVVFALARSLDVVALEASFAVNDLGRTAKGTAARAGALAAVVLIGVLALAMLPLALLMVLTARAGRILAGAHGRHAESDPSDLTLSATERH